MLQDNFGRRFEYLRLSVTDVCNFKCNYCLPDGYDCNSDRDFMSFDEIKTLVSAFALLGMKKIRITGGEPGLRKDLVDIIRMCRQTPGIEQVGLTTNGFNLERNIEKWRDAGLTNLNVSLDSLDPRMFHAITGHEKFESIMRGIDKAVALGIKSVKLNAVLLKTFNRDQLGTYLNWIADKSITVRFIELMETGDNQQFFKENHVSGQEIQQHLEANGWQAIERGTLAGPAKEYRHPNSQGKIGLIMPYSKDFCKSCNRLRVSATGKLHLCLFAEQGIDLRQGLSEGNIGQTCSALTQAMQSKVASHELQQHLTGSTKHLAMLGG